MKRFGIAVLLLFALALVACASPQAVLTPASTTITDYASLQAALSDVGIDLSGAQQLEDSVFPDATLRAVELPDGTLQVFEFADAAAAQAAAETVTANGYTVGTTAVEWVDTPHFFRAGELIVLYVGQNQETLDALQGVLGQPFTGAQ